VDEEISQNFRIPTPNERRIVLDHKARLTATLLLFKINELSESLFFVNIMWSALEAEQSIS
jgi:hypothetical protein